MKTKQYTASITAPVETVWKAMLEPETYKVWTAEFAQGSSYEGSWDKGAKIRFISPSGDGMLSEIVENNLHEFISIKHIGMIINGIEDTESPEVKKWTPAYENYSFSVTDNGTTIIVDINVPDEYEKFFDETWPKALSILKQICEKHQ